MVWRTQAGVGPEGELSGSAFDDVDRLIISMYYLYKKSKNLRQMKSL